MLAQTGMFLLYKLSGDACNIPEDDYRTEPRGVRLTLRNSRIERFAVRGKITTEPSRGSAGSDSYKGIRHIERFAV